MQIILKLFLLLINIDQETVLNFFGVENPESYLQTTLEGSSISTEISLQTIKIVFQGLLERYQNGLGLVDIENIILFITFIRFLILSIRYNIKTSFYISCISLFASLLWYFHIRDMNLWYTDLLVDNRLTSNIAEDLIDREYIMEAQSQNQMFLDFINEDPINFLKSSFVKASEKNGYRIDPISMIISYIPQHYKAEIDKLYYWLYGRFFPNTWNFLEQQIREIWPLLSYLIIVRLNKKYCPYLIRWHWTFILVNTFIEIEFVKLVFRLWAYQNYVLIPEGRYEESTTVESLFMGIITLHYLFNWFGLFHAACGQYFYIPFIVENTEIHIGKRPINSIYSGGYTSWQAGNIKQLDFMKKKNKKFIFPRIWWGWFGKTDENTNEQTYRKKQQKLLKNKQNKGLKKLIRKFKKWILRS